MLFFYALTFNVIRHQAKADQKTEQGAQGATVIRQGAKETFCRQKTSKIF